MDMQQRLLYKKLTNAIDSMNECVFLYLKCK